jgi:hypothetical protein
MSTSDGAQLANSAQAGEANEFFNVNFIRAPGFGIGQVGEPFELGAAPGCRTGPALGHLA